MIILIDLKSGSLRDFNDWKNPANPTSQFNKEMIDIHELGHIGGASDGDGGVMGTAGGYNPSNNDRFTPISINKLRANTKW